MDIRYNPEELPYLQTVVTIADKTMAAVREHNLPMHQLPALASMLLVRSTRGLAMDKRRLIFDRFHMHLMKLCDEFKTADDADAGSLGP
jgi:hypothetical protein